jgi:predicted permease
MPEWTDEIRARVAPVGLGPERELELVEELSAHLDDLYRESLAEGATAAEARSRALAALEAPGLLAHGLSPLRRSQPAAPRVVPGAPSRGLAADLLQDVRYGLRGLRDRPGFTAAAVATLALGIGANTAIFSVVNAVLLQRLPVRESHRVVHVNGEGGNVLSYPEYAELRDRQRAFDGLAAWGGIVASLNDGGAAQLVQGLIVTGNYFEVLGLQPALGRLIASSDDVTPKAHPVVVLDHAFWRSRFAGRPDVIGSDVRLNGQRFTIVGVAPARFSGTVLGGRRSLYVPMMMQAVMRPPRAGYSGEMDPDLLRRRGNRWLTGLGRLKPGRSLEQARSEVSTLATSLEQALPADARRPGPIRMALVPVDVGNAEARARLRSVATLLMAVVGAVLLLACANVANLLLSRAAARRREIAVRLALGARRFRLVRQLLTESVLLSCGGGLAGLLLAVLILAAFGAAPPPPGALPITVQARVDPRVLLFTLALAVGAGVAFGLAPALTATRSALVPVLKDESFVPDERSRRVSLRGAIVVAQVALSVLLLVAAGLFLRNLCEIQAVDPGFDTERLLSTELPVNLLRYTTAQGREFYRRVVEEVEAVPGVEQAAVARVALLGGRGRTSSLHIEGRQGPANQFQSEGGSIAGPATEQVRSNVVGPGFFRTLGAELRAGRVLDEQDVEGAPLVAVVSEAFRRLHFPDRPGERVLGKRLSLNGPEGPWREIVGVVGDTKYATLTEAPQPVVFLPLGQRHETGVVLYVRATSSPVSLVPAVRAVVRGLEPNLPLAELRTLSETVSASTWTARTAVALLGAFSLLALALASVGVYGVTSFQVAQRTREIGVRVALGARDSDVLRMVLGGGLCLVALGVALGLALALAAGRLLESLLYGVSGRDPVTLASVPLLLGAVAFLACLVAARQATRLDPVVALRQG